MRSLWLSQASLWLEPMKERGCAGRGKEGGGFLAIFSYMIVCVCHTEGAETWAHVHFSVYSAAWASISRDCNSFFLECWGDKKHVTSCCVNLTGMC